MRLSLPLALAAVLATAPFALAAACGGARVSEPSEAGPSAPSATQPPPMTWDPNYEPPNGQCEGCGVCYPCQDLGGPCTWNPNCAGGLRCVDGKCSLGVNPCTSDDGCPMNTYCSCSAAGHPAPDPDAAAPNGCADGICALRKYAGAACTHDDIDAASPGDCILPMRCDCDGGPCSCKP
jgi:hypothetical protein